MDFTSAGSAASASPEPCSAPCTTLAPPRSKPCTKASGVSSASWAVSPSSSSSAPAPHREQPHGGPSGTGVVMSIAESEVGSRTGSIVGAIGGAIVGSVVGGQIGSGFGRTVASTARQYRRVDDRQQHGIADGGGPKWTITVRFSDGIDRDIRSKTPPEVRPGRQGQRGQWGDPAPTR